MKSTVVKTSISLKPHNWSKLEKLKNRSVVINQALELFFEREKYMKNAEEKWLHDMAEEGLRDVANGDVYVMNPHGGKLTKKQIDKILFE